MDPYLLSLYSSIIRSTDCSHSYPKFGTDDKSQGRLRVLVRVYTLRVIGELSTVLHVSMEFFLDPCRFFPEFSPGSVTMEESGRLNYSDGFRFYSVYSP